jgi:hypothetical protein
MDGWREGGRERERERETAEKKIMQDQRLREKGRGGALVAGGL